MEHRENRECMDHKDHVGGGQGGQTGGTHTWGTRQASASGIVKKVKEYLWEHPANYNGQVDALLELLYYAFAEYNTVETPEFKEQTDPLKEKLRALADTEQEADEYMDIVFALCVAYEREGYIEGIKVGMRLVIEMVEG